MTDEPLAPPPNDPEETRGREIVRSTDSILAPATLRMSVQDLIDDAGEKHAARRRRRRWSVAPAAVAVAAIIVAVVLVANGGTGTLTVRSAARVTLAAATGPAPAVDHRDTDHLALRAAGIPFPSYVHDSTTRSAKSWIAVGTRRDTLGGRTVTTVFYRSPTGQRVGYAIVSGRSLAQPAGSVFRAGGVRYVLARADGARLVTWRRDGHTCVIAGRGVGPRALLSLARADELTA